MWSENQIIEYLNANLNPKRFQHSISVMETAVSLAKRYKVDEEKAKLAGLAHDSAKNLKNMEINDLLEKNGYNIDIMFRKSSNVMHGLAGSIIANDVMGISDEEVLNAIAYHTTGRANMSILEKIIYIADYIEPLRNFNGVETLRALAYENLDEALLLSFNNTIKYVIDKGELIHKDTIEARNFILFTKN